MPTVTAEPARPSRRYVSSRRQRQAEQTRADVLAAAATLFAEAGWAGTTITAVAARAGVAVETVYAGYGTKKALLLAAMHLAVSGQADPVPFAERPWVSIVQALPPGQRLDRAMDAVLQQYTGPVLGVWTAMQEAAGSHADVAAACHEHETRRHQTTRAVLALIWDRDIDDHIVDAAWAAASLEVYRRLIHDRGWTPNQWRTYIITVTQALLGPPDDHLQLTS